jgi:hypothetical protein
MTKFSNVGESVSLVDRTRIMKWLKPIIAETAEFEKVHLQLLQKYGKRNEQKSDQFTIPPGAQLAYQGETEKLEATEVEVPVVPLPMESYDGKVPLTVGDLLAMKPFVIMPEAPPFLAPTKVAYRDLLALRDRPAPFTTALDKCKAISDLPLVEKAKLVAFVGAFTPPLAAYEKEYRKIFVEFAEKDERGELTGNVDPKRAREFDQVAANLAGKTVDVGVVPLPLAFYEKLIPFSVADLSALEPFIEMPQV